MRLIYNKGFSFQERKQWKVTIFTNLVHAFQVIFGAMEEQDVDFADAENIVRRLLLSQRHSLADIHAITEMGGSGGCRSRDRTG